MFEITADAAAQVLVAAEQGGTQGMALRMAAQRKSDGSIDYLMGFDEAKDSDVRTVIRGIDIVMESKYIDLLDVAVMDYVKMDDGDFRFIFINPDDANYEPPTPEKRKKTP